MFHLPAAKPVQRAANIRRITRELLHALPPHNRFFQLLEPDDESAIAFALAGCTIYQLFTYRVAIDADLTALWDNVEGHLRRHVRKTRAAMTITTHGDFDRFVAVSRREREGGRNTHDYATLERIFRACDARGQTTIMTAVTADGSDAACVILIWGHGTLYYWAPTVDRAKGGGGANALLFWNAIEFAAAKRLLFDSDGYASGAAGKFFCGFGLPIARRTGVVHANTLGRLQQLRVDTRAARSGTAPVVHKPRRPGAGMAPNRR